MRKTGTYQILGNIRYFIPYPLPPANPPLNLNNEIIALYGQAHHILGQLNEISTRLPDQKRFIKAYVIKEALLSSSIEGIHTTLIDIFTHTFEDSKPSKNTQLVLNYMHALDVSWKMIKAENLPVSTRVILKAHEALMSVGEGDQATPGYFRKQSVRVGNLVPPPAPEVYNLMSDLEKYINTSSELPPLIQTGLVHVHFETIHPFLDGNGRIGRLLIVLMLLDSGLLNVPILYPSYYFKKHHMEYYQKLNGVQTQGDFEGWILYYLKAIKESALDAYIRAQEIENLEINLKKTIQSDNNFTKMRDTALLVLDFLFAQPICSIAQISQELGKAYNTIKNSLDTFTKMNIVSESIVGKRNKLYRFEPYLMLLEKQYE